MIINYSRVISTSVITPIIAIIFVILILLTLKRDKDYLANKFLVFFYILIIIACITQLIYLYSSNIVFITYGNLFTITSLNLGSFFLFLSILVIYRGETYFFRDKKIIFMMFLILFFIITEIFLVEGISVSENYKPVWSMNFGFCQFILSQGIIAIQFFLSVKIYKKVIGSVRNKFRYFIIGIGLLDVHLIWLIIYNLNIIPLVESFGTIFQLCGLIGAFLLYYGMIQK
ncbi:MAG: hypothetical protein GF329_08805 [Candidatus Lokiarchaeota archaeon]|nr:hypothetical protein [Candidatus Lokiarchaeota archaeon]